MPVCRQTRKTMGISKYTLSNGKTFWQVNTWLTLPDGTAKRFSKRKIPTREQAVALEAKKKSEAFEGRYLPEREAAKTRAPSLSVAEAWRLYEPVSARDNDSHATDRGRAAHVTAHVGNRAASSLTLADIEAYREARLAERTKRGAAPSPATLDREVELLKRVLNHAVACGKLSANSVAKVKLLRKPNVRRTVVDEDLFAKLLAAAEPSLRPILVVLFDTGMRLREALNLRWATATDAYGLDLASGTVRLHPEATKGNDDRVVHLTERALAALRAMPRRLGCPFVFPNPETGRPWQDVRKAWQRACAGAGLDGIWIHDLRRSFATRARRAEIPESVVMRMGGWRTRAVFDRYNVVADDDVREAARRLEAAAGRRGRVLDEIGGGGAEDTKAPRS